MRLRKPAAVFSNDNDTTQYRRHEHILRRIECIVLHSTFDTIGLVPGFSTDWRRVPEVTKNTDTNRQWKYAIIQKWLSTLDT
jgi:hypothetical protein